MTITVATGSWTVPPNRALWLPGNTRATISNRTRVAVRSLYFATSLTALPDTARAVTLPRFCRELLLHVVDLCPLDLEDPIHTALLTVLIDQLDHLPETPLWLPAPRDPRAADFATAARADPTTSTADLARSVGSSRRTLERLFATETGLSLGTWGRRAHLLDSLALLAAGTPVTQTATTSGYTTPSAYTAAFHRELGATPSHFLHP